MKNTHFMTFGKMVLLGTGIVMLSNGAWADDGDRLDRRGDRIEERLDNKGDRIDRRLDRKGQRKNQQLDRRSKRR